MVPESVLSDPGDRLQHSQKLPSKLLPMQRWIVSAEHPSVPILGVSRRQLNILYRGLELLKVGGRLAWHLEKRIEADRGGRLWSALGQGLQHVQLESHRG